MKLFKYFLDALNNFLIFFADIPSSEKNQILKYNKMILTSAEFKENKIYGNFSFEGLYFILENLFKLANFEILIFIRNYESVFTLDNYYTLRRAALRLQKNNRDIYIYTFDGNKSERFKQLSDEFENVKYVPLKFNNENGIGSNFIIVDQRSYWLEEDFTTMARTEITDKSVIKACVNFNDTKRSAELIGWINDVNDEIKDK
jgi:hypothetical protein